MSTLGKYRNKQGVELEITGVSMARNIIGTVYEGTIPDNLFGPRHMLVTPEGLTDCGYVKIEDSEVTA
jgi:hypothetical protein